MQSNPQLGLGAIGIGRAWGHVNPVVPSEEEAFSVLEKAVQVGYRFIDTAPSYGYSEQRLGRFLRAHGVNGLTIATKFGENWNFERGETYVDHSYDGLCRSVDRSMQVLGRIDVLQLHKTTPHVLRSRDLSRAWDYAASLGITIAEEGYSVVQAPYSRMNRTFEDVLRRASARGITVVTNRPFFMGQMLHGDARWTEEDALRFIVEQGFNGVILAGSKNPVHLERNCRVFCAVLSTKKLTNAHL
jgi:aryl-alcohol dehydrogenase-like predicted oxidoreductase